MRPVANFALHAALAAAIAALAATSAAAADTRQLGIGMKMTSGTVSPAARSAAPAAIG